MTHRLPTLQRGFMHSTAVFYGEALGRYGFGRSHPLGTDRLQAFWSRFQSEGLHKSSRVKVEDPVLAEESLLLEFHAEEYVKFVKKASAIGEGYLDHGDTPAFRGVFEASSFVVGSTLRALDLLMRREAEHAFNPIGGLHHARRDSAGGFCVFNDIGVAILAARKNYNVRRIAYVDIDAHHGDGVFYEFLRDPLLFIADIHEDGRYLYPGTGFEQETGEGEAKGTKLNIPLQPYATDDDFIGAFQRVEEFVDRAKPELIILQCGADGLKGDPITHLWYSPAAHRHAASALHKLAHRHCGGRIIALGGGGYSRENLAAAWSEVVRAFITD